MKIKDIRKEANGKHMGYSDANSGLTGDGPASPEDNAGKNSKRKAPSYSHKTSGSWDLKA
ncbi:hypothetical protein ANCCEY_12316 [Ancylostoma ceylanicum]|uniref:Uncharacterized protein n=1 Tax=Ancylostoma ceylanicum TaxID=53326 RepID=A0A0D6L9H7_9BILA|nr:hypothetical protein ANCCEY_12316 [Ancylostoma ceylanicum]